HLHWQTGNTFRIVAERDSAYVSVRHRSVIRRQPMRYRTLGRTGIQVSPYALGTLMFASSMGNSPEESARILHAALDAGINLVDTADAYEDSEEIVGKALAGRRDDVVLATSSAARSGRTRTTRARPGAGSSPRWRIRCAACGP